MGITTSAEEQQAIATLKRKRSEIVDRLGEKKGANQLSQLLDPKRHSPKDILNARIAAQSFAMWRTKAGFTQNAVAKLVGVGVSTVQRFESGVDRLSEETIAKILVPCGLTYAQITSAKFRDDLRIAVTPPNVKPIVNATITAVPAQPTTQVGPVALPSPNGPNPAARYPLLSSREKRDVMTNPPSATPEPAVRITKMVPPTMPITPAAQVNPVEGGQRIFATTSAPTGASKIAADIATVAAASEQPTVTPPASPNPTQDAFDYLTAEQLRAVLREISTTAGNGLTAQTEQAKLALKGKITGIRYITIQDFVAAAVAFLVLPAGDADALIAKWGGARRIINVDSTDPVKRAVAQFRNTILRTPGNLNINDVAQAMGDAGVLLPGRFLIDGLATPTGAE